MDEFEQQFGVDELSDYDDSYEKTAPFTEVKDATPSKPQGTLKRVYPKKDAPIIPADLNQDDMYAQLKKQYLAEQAQAEAAKGPGLLETVGSYFSDIGTASGNVSRAYQLKDRVEYKNETFGRIAEATTFQTPYGIVGGAIGTAVLPGVGTAVGAALGSVIGAGIYGFVKDKDDTGILESLPQDHKIRTLLSRYTINPNDSETTIRIKNSIGEATSESVVGGVFTGVAKGAQYLAKTRYGKPVANLLEKLGLDEATQAEIGSGQVAARDSVAKQAQAPGVSEQAAILDAMPTNKQVRTSADIAAMTDFTLQVETSIAQAAAKETDENTRRVSIKAAVEKELKDLQELTVVYMEKLKLAEEKDVLDEAARASERDLIAAETALRLRMENATQMSIMDFAESAEQIDERRRRAGLEQVLAERRAAAEAAEAAALKAENQAIRQSGGQKRLFRKNAKGTLQDAPSSAYQEQAFLFDMDDADIAGLDLSVDPRQLKLFDEQFEVATKNSVEVEPPSLDNFKGSGRAQSDIHSEVETQAALLPEAVVLKESEPVPDFTSIGFKKARAAKGIPDDVEPVIVRIKDDAKLNASDNIVVEAMADGLQALHKQKLSELPKGATFKQMQGMAEREFAAMTDADKIKWLMEFRRDPTMGTGIMDAQQTVRAMHLYRELYDNTVLEFQEKLARGANDLELFNLLLQNDNLNLLGDMYAVERSKQGTALGVGRLIRDAVNNGDEKALKLLAHSKRAMMIRDVLKDYGGRDSAENMLKAAIAVRRAAANEISDKELRESSRMLAGLTDKNLQKILAKAREINALADKEFSLVKAKSGLDYDAEILSASDKVWNFMRGNLLLHPKVFSNVTMYGMNELTFQNVRRVIQAVGPYGAEARQLAYTELATNNFMANLWAGLSNAKAAFVEGARPVTDSVRIYYAPNGEIVKTVAKEVQQVYGEANPNNLFQMWNRGLGGKFEAVMGSGYRLLASAEAIFGHLAEESSLRAQYAIEAMNKGYSRDQAVEYVEKAMRIGEHPNSFVIKARHFAAVAALNNTPETPAGRFVADLASKPVIRFMAPFGKAEVNSVEKAVSDFFPFFGEYNNLPGGEKAARMTTAYGVLGMLVYARSEGWFRSDVVVARPGDFKEDGEKSKFQYNSVTLSLPWLGKEVTIGADQVGFSGPNQKVLRMAEALYFAGRVLEDDEVEALKYAAVGALSFLKPENMFEAVSSLGGLIGGLTEAGSPGEGLARAGGDVVGNVAKNLVPFTRIQQDANRLWFNQIERDQTGAYGDPMDMFVNIVQTKIQSAIAPFGGKMPPAFNVLGEEVSSHGPTSYSATTSDTSETMDKLHAINMAAAEMQPILGKINTGIALPPKHITFEDGTSVKLNQKEYADLVGFMNGVTPDGMRYGPTLRERLTPVLAGVTVDRLRSALSTPDGAKYIIGEVADVYSAARKEAQDNFLAYQASKGSLDSVEMRANTKRANALNGNDKFLQEISKRLEGEDDEQ